jgi:hypothetical protein
MTPNLPQPQSQTMRLECIHQNRCSAVSALMAVSLYTVNDPPSFTRGSATVTVAEDSAPYSAAWATNISSGPGESDPLAFSISCSSANTALFAVAPAMNAAGQLSFTTGPDMFGSASCIVRLTEQIPNGLSANSSLTIVVTPGECAAVAQQFCGCFCMQASWRQFNL